MSATSSVDLTKAMTYKDLMVTGLRIANREAGKPANPKLMLLYSETQTSSSALREPHPGSAHSKQLDCSLEDDLAAGMSHYFNA
jgi:hypothetical protein